jgi:hypothetical protein
LDRKLRRERSINEDLTQGVYRKESVILLSRAKSELIYEHELRGVVEEIGTGSSEGEANHDNNLDGRNNFRRNGLCKKPGHADFNSQQLLSVWMRDMTNGDKI